MTTEEQHVLEILSGKIYKFVLIERENLYWTDDNHPISKVVKISKRHWSKKQAIRGFKLGCYFMDAMKTKYPAWKSNYGFYISPYYDTTFAFRPNDL